MTGAEFKTIRKGLAQTGWTISQVAEYFGVTENEIKEWEKSKEVPKIARWAIRGLDHVIDTQFRPAHEAMERRITLLRKEVEALNASVRSEKSKNRKLRAELKDLKSVEPAKKSKQSSTAKAKPKKSANALMDWLKVD